MPAFHGTTAADSYPLLHSAQHRSTIVPRIALLSISFRVRLPILIAASLFALYGCSNKPDPPAEAPAGVTATDGDGVVLMAWDQLPDRTYWIFFAQGNSVSPGQIGSIAIKNAVSPRAVTGLLNDTDYALVMNASNQGSAAGPNSQVVM